MSRAKNPLTLKGKTHFRGVRKDAVAIGTIIASLPETLEHFDPVHFEHFAEETTAWAREFLASREMLLHFRLEHLDELYPHMHLWFTPKGVELGDGTWSFASVLGRQKMFLHNFKMSYFDAVGHKYAIRPFVVGRKNWLFSHTPSGAHASAAIYSLIETAKANGLVPYEYLQHVFETLPTLAEDDDLDMQPPWRWQETLPL